MGAAAAPGRGLASDVTPDLAVGESLHDVKPWPQGLQYADQ